MFIMKNDTLMQHEKQQKSNSEILNVYPNSKSKFLSWKVWAFPKLYCAYLSV